MQTFLPYPDFVQTSKVLDNKRLGKQRVEALQILQVLAIGPYQMLINYRQDNTPVWESCNLEEFNESKKNKTPTVRKTPWYNHPAVQMWRGYDRSLVEYGFNICNEWSARGFRDTCYPKFRSIECNIEHLPVVIPYWIGDNNFHCSHQSNLIRKLPEYYTKYFPGTPNNLAYIWPSKDLIVC